jgi:pimeloyl-ACP methyl ester carboxylesterase
MLLMNRRSHACLILLIIGLFRNPVGSQAPANPSSAVWRDPSPHRVQFVTVEPGVRLEVLDWGGLGRNVVLLAGSGNSAHVFDDFAPKLSAFGHVVGVTRRGFGTSSQPAVGYDDQRLADDVLAILDSLRLAAPVLIGHSMAGQEMTTLGRQHSDRLSGLVYLDAHGDPGDDPGADSAWVLPEGFRNPPRRPFTGDGRTFPGYRASLLAGQGFTFPESEFRNTYETNPDGTRGRYKSTDIPPRIGRLQIPKNFTNIRVPVLALFEFPRTIDDYPRPGEYVPSNAAERDAIAAFLLATKNIADRWSAKLLKAVPDAKLIDVPGAGHFLFLTRETEVIREIRIFLARLPQVAPSPQR